MKKRIIIEIETETEDFDILRYLKLWMIDSFQKYDDAKIKIEEIKNETPMQKMQEDNN